jgi:hypothetical protein
MMRAVFGCRYMQTSREKVEMKNIPGAASGGKERKSNHAAEVLR